MILESNSQVITSLREYYKVLQESDDFPLAITCKGEIYAFLTKLSYVVSDLKMHVARADLMLKIMNDRKDLVGHCNSHDGPAFADVDSSCSNTCRVKQQRRWNIWPAKAREKLLP